VHVFRGSIDGTIRSDSGDNAIQSKEDDWVNPTDYTVHYDEKTRTLNVDLPHDNGVYFVEFDTSLAGQLVDTTSYTNTAAFVNGGEHHDVTGTVTVDHGGDYIDKSGQKDGSVVDWSVDVNPSQSTLSDVKVVDIPSRNQFVDVNSVAVYEMMPNSEGKNTVYRKAVAGADYTVSVVTDYQNTGAQVLIVKFNKTINRAYRVDYEAKINSSADQATLSNQVSIIADHVTKTYQQKTATVIIDHDGGSASGEVGPNLRFKLTKVDGDNPSVPLAGVGFELFMAKKSGQNNPDGSPVYVKDGEVIRKGTTGDDGTLSWSNLKPGEYILQEDLSTTPEGYIAGAYAKGKHITIKANGEKDADGNLVDNQTIANNEYHGEVTLKKTALHTGERVKGATYELYRVSADGQATDTNRSGTTTDDGEFSLWNLAPGDYYLVETKAPAGYLLNKEKYSFTIARDKMANLFQTVNATDAKWRGSVEVTKRDFDQMDIALPGAEFKLYNDADEIQAIVMTGGNGVARVNGLLPGKYYFKEVEAPTGYKLNSDKKYYVNVVQTGSSEPSRQGDTVLPAGAKATVYDEEKPGSAILLKLDGFTKEGLAGAEFNLYSTQTGTLLRHGLTTDSNGKLQIPNLVPGGYYLVETKTPAGYILPAIQQQFHFTVVFNQQEGQAVEVKALNTPYLGRLQLTKENKQNGAAVANAVYGLFNTKGVQTRTLTTDAQGNAVAEYLEPGAYTLRELKAPAGFSLNATTYHVTIGKKTNGDMVHMLVFDDIQGNVQLTKRDAQNQQPVVGAVYNLYAADGKLVKQHLATSQSGNIKVTDLVPGDYYFREIQAPTGYDLNTAQVPVVVALNQPNKTALVTTDDQETKGGVVLSKTDATSGQVLPGAHFALYETDGTLVRSGLTTSANGQLVVNDLTPGDYYFRETQAPNGYTLNANNHYAFTVDFNQQQVARVHVTNKQSVGGVRLVKSDAATGELLADAQFSLYREDGTLVRSNLNTDVNGEVVVLGLLPGQYYFVETKAPAGYMLNEQNSTPFTIGLGQQSLVQVDVTNAPQPPLPDTFGPEPPAPGNRTPGNPPLPDTFGNNDNPPLPDTYGSNQRPATHRKARAGKHQRLLQKVFPQTGDSVSYGLIVAGLILLALETTLLYLRRKHRA
jgi:LPXTG-motif cell wall-anchored protein